MAPNYLEIDYLTIFRSTPPPSLFLIQPLILKVLQQPPPPMSLCSILFNKALFPKRKIGHLILAYYKLLIAKNVIVSVSLRRH